MRIIIKRSFSLLLALITAFVMIVEVNAVRSNEFTQIQSESVSTVEPRVTGLIYSYSFSANKDGYNLLVYTDILCSSTVVKCGIKEMVIERRVSTDYGWSEYLTYSDLYQESNFYGSTKSIPVTTGYQYRVVATLYAKKSLLSTEKIEVTSNIVWI